MNLFKMRDHQLKPGDIRDPKIPLELERDEHGRLYSVRLRELMGPVVGDLSAIEALSALRFAGLAIHRLQDRWAERHGLTEGRLAVMFRLMRGGPTHLGDLATELDTSPRNMTGLVDNLERDGLVERVPDPDDRRSVRAQLTAAGKERIEAIWKEGVNRQFEVVQGFTEDELAELRHLCLKLVESARKELGNR